MKLLIYILTFLCLMNFVYALNTTTQNCTYDPNEFYRLEKVDLTNINFIGRFALANKYYLLIETNAEEQNYLYFRTIKGKTYFLEEKPLDFSADYVMKLNSCNIQKLIKNQKLFPELYKNHEIEIRSKYVDYHIFRIYSPYVLQLYELIK